MSARPLAEQIVAELALRGERVALAESLTGGLLTAEDSLAVVVESDALVVFGDGLEAGRLNATWGQTITLSVAERTLLLA